jgi:hypothetical protein
MRVSMHIMSTKKNHDPDYTMSLHIFTPLFLPPDAPPLAPLDANTYEMINAVLAMLNLSGGPNIAHHFIVIASSAHIIIVVMCINSHINSNKYLFFLVLTM